MNAPPENTAAFYDDVWRAWGHLDDRSPAAFHRRRKLLELVRDHARSSRRVLEVGCGQGALLRELTREFPGALVHGSDVSNESLARARSLCPNAELFVLDLAAPYLDAQQSRWQGHFDLIVCSEVLEHLSNDAEALERLHGLLAPRGSLIVSVPAGERTRFDRAIGHVRHYSADTLSEKLYATGFQVERVFAWGFPFHSFYRWIVKWAAHVSFGESSAPPNRSALLEHGYTAFSLALKPLYYLNRMHAGPQLFAVARRA